MRLTPKSLLITNGLGGGQLCYADFVKSSAIQWKNPPNAFPALLSSGKRTADL